MRATVQRHCRLYSHTPPHPLVGFHLHPRPSPRATRSRLCSVRWIASWPKQDPAAAGPREKKLSPVIVDFLLRYVLDPSNFFLFSSSFPPHGCHGLFPCACFGELAKNPCFCRRIKVSLTLFLLVCFSPFPFPAGWVRGCGGGGSAGTAAWYPGLDSRQPLDDENAPRNRLRNLTAFPTRPYSLHCAGLAGCLVDSSRG